MSIKTSLPSADLSLYAVLESAFIPGQLRGACVNLPIALFFNVDRERVERAISQCASHLDATYTDASLSPLHLAAMRCNKHAIGLLASKGANPNTVDFQGYTPLHHAAMACNFDVVDQLLASGANPHAKNKHGGTYADLLRFNQETRNSPALPQHQRYYSAHQKDWVDVAPRCVQGREFTDEIVASPQNLIRAWSFMAKDPEPADNFHTLIRESYKQFKNAPPQLEVRPPLEAPSRFCGLFAAQDIEPGEVIAEYVGEYIDESKMRRADREYMWDDLPTIDAKHFMSAAAFANDALPNAMVYHFYNKEQGTGIDGFLSRKLFIALEKIQAGDEITIDYGAGHDVKFPSHRELRQAALGEYLSNHSWEKIVEKANSSVESGLSAKDALDAMNHLKKLLYLLNTPNTLLDLVRQKKFTLDDLKMLLNRFPEASKYVSVYQAFEALKNHDSL